MSVNKFKLYLILYANANASQKTIFSIVGKAQMLLITLTMIVRQYQDSEIQTAKRSQPSLILLCTPVLYPNVTKYLP